MLSTAEGIVGDQIWSGDGYTPISRRQFARMTALRRDTRDASADPLAPNFPSDGSVNKRAEGGKELGRCGSNSGLARKFHKDGEQVAQRTGLTLLQQCSQRAKNRNWLGADHKIRMMT